MNTIELTESQVKMVVSSLKLKAGRKRQSVKNLQKRKDLIVEAVGEKEFNHRIYLRETTATRAELLVANLSPFCEVGCVLNGI